MGNSYSVAREEQEEDEFRRLVEAVEIAQQRSARQGDLENGLGFGYSFLGTEANRVQHAFHSSSDRVQPSAGLVGPALQIPQPVYQVAHTESEGDFIPPRPSASGSSRSSSRSRSPEANVIIIPPPGVGGAYQMQPGLPGMPMGMQPQSLQPTIILAPPGDQQPATAVSPTMGPARPPTATSPAPIIVQPPPQFGRPTEWHYPHSSSAGERSTTAQRREDLPDEQYLEQELYKLRVKPGRSQSVASYNSWEPQRDADMDVEEFEEEVRKQRVLRRPGSPPAVTQRTSESAHDHPVECDDHDDNERRSIHSPTYRRPHDRHSRSHSRRFSQAHEKSESESFSIRSISFHEETP
ncbi:hypothetical protein C8T65DRAFT_695384 [Cerioporus squamosus]|nr:hypothetical protein C8T65DRAFT_695384 [Cerioporus squamosus]